jgi:hypothetical protein
MIDAANSCGAIYTTSDKNEGMIILINTKHPYPSKNCYQDDARNSESAPVSRLPRCDEDISGGRKEITSRSYFLLTLVNTRQFAEKSFMYDMVRE